MFTFLFLRRMNYEKLHHPLSFSFVRAKYLTSLDWLQLLSILELWTCCSQNLFFCISLNISSVEEINLWVFWIIALLNICFRWNKNTNREIFFRIILDATQGWLYWAVTKSFIGTVLWLRTSMLSPCMDALAVDGAFFGLVCLRSKCTKLESIQWEVV